MKYLRLLRLQDQYIQIGFALAAGVYLHIREFWIVQWALACTFFSLVAFIVNQLTDQRDVDQFSHNPVHLRRDERFDPWMVSIMIGVFSFIGLWLSRRTELLWWGIAVFILGVMYSQEPVRFKKRLGLDIVTQLAVWFVIPFVAPLWGRISISEISLLVLVINGLSWCIFYPYQLADFEGDRKAGLGATHVVLGMRKSLWFGFLCGITGVITFLGAGIYKSVWWLWPLVFLTLFVLVYYWRWMRMKTIRDQTTSMVHMVKTVKPLTQLLLPYILILWFIL